MDYIQHNDAKSEGDAGFLRRKWLEIDSSSVHYIGKESNELERVEVLGVFREDTLEYVNEPEKICRVIESLSGERRKDWEYQEDVF